MAKTNRPNYSKYYYIRKSKKNKAYLASLIAAAVFFVVVLAASANFTYGYKKYGTDVGIEFSYLSIAAFDEYATAADFAKSSKLKGAAGYVYENKKYFALAAVYFDSQKAAQVLEIMLKREPNAKLITFSMGKINHGKLEDNQKQLLSTAITSIKDTLLEIYDISAALDREDISHLKARERLREAAQCLSETYVNVSLDKAFTKDNLNEFTNAIYTMSAHVSKAILTELTSENIRYTNISMCQELVKVLV